MPKPNIFDFNATGSTWDPDVSASVSLTPEVSESIRLLNATIENYIANDGLTDAQGNILEFRRHDQGNIGTSTPILKVNLDEAGMDGDWIAACGPALVEAWHQSDRIWQISGVCADVVLSPGGGHGGLGDNIKLFNSSPGQHRKHAPAIMNLWNSSYQSPPTGSHFMALWNVMSGSGGVVSESVFLLGTLYNEPFLGIGTTSPSASLHISSSITGSTKDLIRVQNEHNVPIFKVKPDRIILRNSGSSLNEVTMSVDSQNNLMFNDSVGINHNYMYIKSGSKKVKIEVGASSGDLKFKNEITGKELFRVRQPITPLRGEASHSITTGGDIYAKGFISSSGGLYVDGDLVPAISNVGGRTVISASNDIGLDAGDDIIFKSEGTEIVHIRGDEAELEVTGDITLTGDISASGTGSFGNLEIEGAGNALLEVLGDISGSSISTGSFGHLMVGGGTFTSASLAAGGGGGGSGTVTSVATAGTVNGITLTGGAITSTGTITLGGTLAVDISADTNLAAGTNITLTGDTLSVDDAFLINSGDDTTSGIITAGGFVTTGDISASGDLHLQTDETIYLKTNTTNNMFITSDGININLKGGLNVNTTGNSGKALTVQGDISASGDLDVVNVSGSGNLVLGGGTFTSASLAAGGSGGGSSAVKFQIHVPMFPRILVVNNHYVQDYPGNSRFSTTLGTSIGSEVYTVGSKNANYVAMSACKLNKFYATVLNPTNDDKLIFAIYKGTYVINSNAAITLTQIGSDIAYALGVAEDKNYRYSKDFTSGNTLSAHDFLVITVRVSSLTGTIFPYINSFLELEYT